MAAEIPKRTWQQLEDLVTQLYRDTGAEKAVRDLDMAGHQIDVYVEIKLHGIPVRIAVECKNHEGPIGINDLTPHLIAFQDLRSRQLIDVAIVVSSSGFTKKSREALSSAAIGGYTVEQLETELLSFSQYLQVTSNEITSKQVFSNDCYITQAYIRNDGDRAALDARLEAWLESTDSLLLLLGDFGTGKTTFLQRIWVDLAEQCTRESMSQPVPIFLRLREVNESPSLRSYITDALINQYGIRFRNYQHIADLAAAGRFVLLLDGFDEMAIHAEAAHVHRNLQGIADLCKGNAKIVVTSRQSVFGGDGHVTPFLERVFNESTTAGYEVVHMARFSPTDIEAYVTKQCDSPDELLRLMKKTYNLMDLGSRPFLLELMLKELPKLIADSCRVSPATVYESYVKNWLDRDGWRVLTTREQRLFVMEELAAYALVEGKRAFASSDIQEVVSAVLGDAYDRADIRDAEQDIQICSFLDARRSGKLVFSHQSFAEYFLARKLCRNLAAESDKAEFVLNKDDLPYAVEQFAIDIAFNVLGLSAETIFEFVFPFSCPVEGLSSSQIHQGIGDSDARILAGSLAEMHRESTSYCTLRAKLGFVLLSLHADAEQIVPALVSLQGHANVADLVNTSILAGSTGLPEAIARWYRETGEQVVHRIATTYFEHVKAYTQRERVVNRYSLEREEPNEAIMRVIESQVDVAESQKDEFRRHAMGCVGALALEGEPFTVDAQQPWGRAIKLQALGFVPEDIWGMPDTP